MSRIKGAKHLRNLPHDENVRRFWEKALVTADAQRCWVWQGGVNNNGYGQSIFHFNDGVTIRPAHRIAYRLAYGSIAKNAVICHRCDVPLCVNPSHLFAGSPADNMADMVAKKRHKYGEQHNKAKLSASDVRSIREQYNKGASAQSLASCYGVSRSTIYFILQKRTWGFVNPIEEVI